MKKCLFFALLMTITFAQSCNHTYYSIVFVYPAESDIYDVSLSSDSSVFFDLRSFSSERCNQILDNSAIYTRWEESGIETVDCDNGRVFFNDSRKIYFTDYFVIGSVCSEYPGGNCGEEICVGNSDLYETTRDFSRYLNLKGASDEESISLTKVEDWAGNCDPTLSSSAVWQYREDCCNVSLPNHFSNSKCYYTNYLDSDKLWVIDDPLYQDHERGVILYGVGGTFYPYGEFSELMKLGIAAKVISISMDNWDMVSSNVTETESTLMEIQKEIKLCNNTECLNPLLEKLTSVETKLSEYRSNLYVLQGQSDRFNSFLDSEAYLLAFREFIYPRASVDSIELEYSLKSLEHRMDVSDRKIADYRLWITNKIQSENDQSSTRELMYQQWIVIFFMIITTIGSVVIPFLTKAADEKKPLQNRYIALRSMLFRLKKSESEESEPHSKENQKQDLGASKKQIHDTSEEIKRIRSEHNSISPPRALLWLSAALPWLTFVVFILIVFLIFHLVELAYQLLVSTLLVFSLLFLWVIWKMGNAADKRI